MFSCQSVWLRYCLLPGLVWSSWVVSADAQSPMVEQSLVFEEVDGVVAVEAEHFFSQELTSKRAFYITGPNMEPQANSDGDPPHWVGASGNAYVEILPDTRRNHGEKLVGGENFSNKPGKLAVLSYKVHFNNPGRYYVWVRAYSTGSEDNGLHVGIDGTWPEHGQRMQWCEGKHSWHWESRQRTEKAHCGVAHEIWLDVDKAGEHTISFSMREDGFEFDRWMMTKDRQMPRPDGFGPAAMIKQGQAPAAFKAAVEQDGDGSVDVTGKLATWHKVTLTQAGPFAFEINDTVVPGGANPFRDVRMNVTFSHTSGSPTLVVPGYFAADGNAGESSADRGNKWRCHFTPTAAGVWDYSVSMVAGKDVAINSQLAGTAIPGCDGKAGTLTITDDTELDAVDFRSRGMLLPSGTHYLKFSRTQRPFFKVGPDAPETLLAYRDFDATRTLKSKAGPLKTYKPHVTDWSEGDPTWRDGKGKGLIGAMNYLAGKGVNAISFLPYNKDGDGSNVWPHVAPTDKLHFDCSKLDQWQIVFDHAQTKGLMLHFKLQETEIDDHRMGAKGKEKKVAGSLDGGKLGPERMLYLRELVARFGYLNAIEWNLGEENTQSTLEQIEMAEFLRGVDPYDHHIVLHTYPQQQKKKYDPLLGHSALTGVSLQNMWDQVHVRTLQWVKASADSGKPWVCANDEQGKAKQGVPPDPGYQDFGGVVEMEDGRKYDLHDIRKRTLWGNLMAGGAGVMYYFGYSLPQNDLLAEDFRSRDKSWDYCRIAKDFVERAQLPLDEMRNRNDLVGNDDNSYGPMCFGKSGDVWLVYLPEGGDVTVDLSQEEVDYKAAWFNPRKGGKIKRCEIEKQRGKSKFTAPGEKGDDWLLFMARERK